MKFGAVTVILSLVNARIMQQQARKLTAQRVAEILKAAIIPTKGANKLSIVGRGNAHTREDGTQVAIFNVQAFASQKDAEEAAGYWKQGAQLEKSGDLDGAQDHYKKALNKMMSFSVLSGNAEDFSAAYEVNCVVEDVATREGGTKLGINRPRPVSVERAGQSTAHLFAMDEETKEALDEGLATEVPGVGIQEETPDTSSTTATGNGNRTRNRQPLGAKA
jgi:hypothetical protein